MGSQLVAAAMDAASNTLALATTAHRVCCKYACSLQSYNVAQVTLWQQTAQGVAGGWQAVKSIHTAAPPTALAWGCKGCACTATKTTTMSIRCLSVVAGEHVFLCHATRALRAAAFQHVALQIDACQARWSQVTSAW